MKLKYKCLNLTVIILMLIVSSFFAKPPLDVIFVYLIGGVLYILFGVLLIGGE